MAATRARQRQWADVVAIFTGLVLLGLAIWPGPQSASAGAAQEASNLQLLWIAHAGAGALALGAVFAAQQWMLRPLARGLLLLAALALIATLITFRDFGPRALLTLLMPALLLLFAMTGIGPMPREI